MSSRPSRSGGRRRRKKDRSHSSSDTSSESLASDLVANVEFKRAQSPHGNHWFFFTANNDKEAAYDAINDILRSDTPVYLSTRPLFASESVFCFTLLP